MTVKKDVTRVPAAGPGALVDSFLDEARRVAPTQEEIPKARLVFALDATMSRQPTWDLACRLQSEMFATASSVGGIGVQLVYFRGFDECRASRWVADPRALTRLMSGLACKGGHTQILRVLRHVRREADRAPVKALVFVGDAMEEPIDGLCAAAGEIGLLGIKAFMFHEGHDPEAARGLREIARLTGGAYARFDANAPQSLAGLLRAAAAYASGGVELLNRLASADAQARRLLVSMGRGS